VYHYNHKRLHHYIADLIVRYYKKKDPSQQSFWNCDSSRLNYIIMSQINNKKKNWIQDKKGVMITEEIIKSFLDLIMEEITHYFSHPIKKKLSTTDLIEKNSTLNRIVKDIEDGHLEIK